jgi:biopolymer transport protein ExbD
MVRRNRRRSQESVELNLAAMLDMAFQLLTFFILTFRPAPIEGQIDLQMPPARTTAVDPPPPTPGTHIDPLFDLRTLVIEVLATDDGAIGSMQVGGRTVDGLGQLDRRIARLLADPAMPFQQVTIQVGPGLRYDALMNVVDVCSRQTLPGGAPLSKLSFIELADRAG